MKSIAARLEALEHRTSGALPVHRMLIGESEEEARCRLGLPLGLDVLFIQRVIITPNHEQH
ncbi:hypothetical protein [Polaromonas sp.]|uniref:hypothetical protein n=1 Tax=Polaromonas sp. TaxID=1869339 RepID=UPI00352B1275